MDLGINGRKAIICASSKGLGRACATSLAREGVIIYLNARNEAVLNQTATELRAETGATVFTVAADINTEAGRAKLVAACAAPDILVNNNAGPPPGKFEDWDRTAWNGAIESNMLAPIFMIQAVVPGMRERKFGRIINITSAMVKEKGITMEQARARIAESIAAKRFGQPKEFGDACAYLCSVQASFISGQNLQLDGGSYAGLM